MILHPDTPPVRPQEQLPVPLFDSVLLAVRAEDGQIFIDLIDLCESLSLNVAPQRRRIIAHERIRLRSFRVLVGRQMRARDFLLLDDLSIWLLTLQSRTVSPAAQARLFYIQTYLDDAVRREFARAVGLPETSREVEDLADLDQINQVLNRLASLDQRQEAIEVSQDRARIAFRDLAQTVRTLLERVEAVERIVKNKLSPQQRGTIYHMVQELGTERAARTPGTSRSTAINRAWSEFNAAFGLATYTDLPASRYDEAVASIKRQYRELTGNDLPAIEQQGLEGLDG